MLGRQFLATLSRESCLPWFVRISGLAGALRYVLDFFGAVALLMVIGMTMMAAKGQTPNAHDFQWFMTKVCPESYMHFRTVTTVHPLPESSLYEACVGEINPTWGK
jgi:hypothetical protein